MKVRPRKRIIKGNVYTDYVVDMGFVDGKRRTRSFGTREEADNFFNEKKAQRRLHGEAALTLPADKALRYAAVEERLALVGASIEQVADFFLEHHQPVRERITLGELLDRCVLDMELRKVANNTIATFACACRSFVVPRGSREAGSVTREEVRTWIYGHQWEPKTQRGYLQALSTLLKWGVDEHYLAKSPLGRGTIKLPKLVRKEPAIFTVEQVARLFTTALNATAPGVLEGQERGKCLRGQTRVFRRLLGFLALATFGGVRPFELVRLEVSAIDLDAAHVALDAKVTKTNDRRVVELSANCVAWLRLWRVEYPDLLHVAPPSWDRLMKLLRGKAELRPWPHDVLRHCFASYFHATHGDKTKLQNQMGHSESEDTLDRHYRAVRGPDGRPVTKEQAAKFWEIGPPALTKRCASLSSRS